MDTRTPEPDVALRDKAIESGYDYGLAHAAYVDAYGGDPHAAPDVPPGFASVATYYTVGYADGVTAYFNDTDEVEPEEPAMPADEADPQLTRAQFVHGIRDLISDASHTDLPDPNRFDVEVYGGTDGPEFINVIARFRNAAGHDRRQHCLLRVVEISATEWNHDHGDPLD